MSFDAIEGGREIITDINTGFIPNITDKVSSRLISLLGMYRLNFNINRDISHAGIRELLSEGKYHLNDFEENGYGCIQRRNPDMGTGYALVSGQYFEKRGNRQGIKLFDQSQKVGETSYVNEKGSKSMTPIYLVGSISGFDGPMGGALNNEDIGAAYQKLLNK